MIYMKRHGTLCFLYLQLAAHFLVGLDESVLVVHHDAIVILLLGDQAESHFYPVFLYIASQGSHLVKSSVA